MMKKLIKVFVFPIIIIFGFFKIAFSYIGPGSGLSALGALLAVIVGLITTIFGLLWYPIKRFFAKKNKKEDTDTETDDIE